MMSYVYLSNHAVNHVSFGKRKGTFTGGGMT